MPAFSFLIICSIFLSLAPIVSNITHIKANLIFLIISLAAVIVLVFQKTKVKITQVELYVIIIITLLSLFFGLYWEEAKLSFYGLYFSLALFCISQTTEITRYYIVHYMSNIILIIVTLAFIGFIYALLGGESLYSFPNPDGRTSYLYLSTFTNFTLGNIIRPSGIFDEPGALSFVVCAICYCREILRMNTRKTWLLLLLSLVTLSLAHLLFLLIYFYSFRSKLLKKIIVILIAIILICLLITILWGNPFFQTVFISRLDFSGGKLAGDTRSGLFYNAIYLIDRMNLIFGLDSLCLTNMEECTKKYGAFGENPLYPYLSIGILSIPYYITLFIFTIRIFFQNSHRFSVIHLGMIMLLLQRPYVMIYGYASLILLCIYVNIKEKNCQRSV